MTQIYTDNEIPYKNSALPLTSLCLGVFVVKLFCFSSHLRNLRINSGKPCRLRVSA
jgi:hypothetical protein